MVSDKNKELLLKLKALAERGVGGEKEVAERKLAQLMEKYGVESVDLEEDKEEDHEFRYQTDYEKMLLRQLFYKIVPDWSSKTYYYRSGKGKRTIYGITCTKAQAIQIGIEYDFYKELWKEEVDFFFSCFIQKHAIFGTSIDGDIRTLPHDEFLRMQQIMDGMQDKSIVKRIEGDN